MGFFQKVFGFHEGTGQDGYKETRDKLLNMATLEQVPSKHARYFRERCDFQVSPERSVSAGIFSTPSVSDLRHHAHSLMDDLGKDQGAKITLRNVVGEARSLHSSDEVTNNHDGLTAPVIVQAASQFNMLEFPSPGCLPESGISDYVFDRTQGPACAVACAGGTAYRNYVVPIPFGPAGEEQQQRGQTRHHQLNGLSDVEQYLMQETSLKQGSWEVRSGYIESSRDRLSAFNKILKSDNGMREKMIADLRIGIQEQVDVTDDPDLHSQVTQTYNSAISIGYSYLLESLWQPLAEIILDATYEATLLAGVIQYRREKPPPIVFLTQVGGGVFQNRSIWIRRAIGRAIREVEKYGVSLDIRIVHFGEIKRSYDELERT